MPKLIFFRVLISNWDSVSRCCAGAHPQQARMNKNPFRVSGWKGSGPCVRRACFVTLQHMRDAAHKHQPKFSITLISLFVMMTCERQKLLLHPISDVLCSKQTHNIIIQIIHKRWAMMVWFCIKCVFKAPMHAAYNLWSVHKHDCIE